MIHPQVRIDSLQMESGNGEFNFKAYASGFPVVAKQIAAFYSNSNVSNVVFGKITTSTSGQVEFGGVLTFEVEKAMKKKINE